MKIYKKLTTTTLAITISTFLFLPNTGFANASENANAEKDFIELDKSYQFESESLNIDDSDGSDYSNDYGTNCIACVGGVTYTVKTNSGPTKVSKKFVKYLTGSWAYSDKYTWSKSNSASATVSADLNLSAKDISSKLGVSATKTTTYSTTVSIPANKSKLSKLAFYSDFDKRNVTVTRKIGKVNSTKRGDHYSPRKDTYLLVSYK
ncbi:hypothetical protein [Rossellomorea marisflavi]|uniref:hypothetical protein n=1 Tax=Rossellomorea marisflavi TaxID=189381 RepID=UPI00064E2450|nr:hypothetical protein [Rossellomorea marisflavi]KMK91846.1 hypothetical protein VL03_17960 [Rossellomorea marisflavi]